MRDHRLSQVCNELGISKRRVEQWISRGILKPDNETVAGSARLITFSDAIRIVAIDRLLEAGVPLEDAARCRIPHLHAFKDESAYLVLRTGFMLEIIPTTRRGDPPPKIGEGRPVHKHGYFDSEIVPESHVFDLITDPKSFASVVLPLKSIEDKVNAAWAALEE